MNSACAQCSRRNWLLGKLSVPLAFRAREPSRLWDLLELPDRELIEAVGGRRRAELGSSYERWEPESRQIKADVQEICRHSRAFPVSLLSRDLAPHTLEVRGGTKRLGEMLGGSVVAIVGSRKASDYGMETARVLARGLAASGVTILSGLAEGIPSAAHSGALEAQGPTLTVMAGDLERCSPAWCSPLYRRIVDCGCAISETPWASRWGEPARARTLALLAQMVIVVEAEERPWDLACAEVARRLGRTVAAVPGRVNAPASKGTNSLLMSGAQMMRGPRDALDLLYGVGTYRGLESPMALEPRLQMVLKQVSDGLDTIAKLTTRAPRSTDITLALAELELQGLLVRGDGGRYLPTVGSPSG